MSGARTAILGRIRAALASLAEKPAPTRGSPAPPAAPVRPNDPVALFVERALASGATVERLERADQVPAAVAAYAVRHGLAPHCRRAGGALLDGIAWAAAQGLQVAEGAAEDADRIGITAPIFGVAETGTLVLASAPQSPTSPAYLPEAHVAVIRRDAVVATYEEAWAGLAAGADFPPRVVAWITGPSRTADIEQTILLGVHGPRLQHIVILDDDGRAGA